MKSKDGAIKLKFMGGLTKFIIVNREVRKFQVKTIGNGNDSEIDGIARAFGKWADYGNVPELSNFGEKVPSAMVPWKITIPMGDFGIYVDMDFGHDIYGDQKGFCLKAMLTEVAFSVKKGDREAVFTFIKNGEESDDSFCYEFLNAKEEDEKGKMVPKPFQVILDECDSFTIGKEPEDEEETEEGDPEPVVYET